jgi:hypothetical protein
MRTRIIATTLVGAVVVTALAAVPAQASPIGPAVAACSVIHPQGTPWTEADLAARSKTVHQAIFTLAREGKSSAEIAASLAANFQVTTPPSASLNDPVIPMHSTNQQISLSTPVIAHDSCSGIYYAYAYWDFSANGSWQVVGYESDCAGCDVGGQDAFGLTFNKSVLITGEDATAWGDTAHYGPSSVPLAKASAYGDIFEKQDRANSDYGDWSMAHGEAVVDLRASSVVCDLGLRSKYVHTWSSAYISGVSVSKDNVTVNVANAANSWPATSHQGFYC